MTGPGIDYDQLSIGFAPFMPKSCKLALAFTIQVSVKVVIKVLAGILISKRKAVIGEII
jgi:hypothetical protein